MALRFGFRGQLYDDSKPLYQAANGGWLRNRVTGQLITVASLAAQMKAENYTPNTGEIAGSSAPVEEPDPIKGSFEVDGSVFWINTDTCEVGFDVDDDGDPDDWYCGEDVCGFTIEDAVKLGISAQLEACGCAPLPCVTAAGNLRKAYTLAELEK